MEAITLSRKDLSYKDHAFVSEYDIILDLLINKKSSLLINKAELNAEIGDIVIIKNKVNYIGIIETLETSDSKQSQVQLLDFRQIFNIKVPILSFCGDIAAFIHDLIVATFKNNRDPLQNLSFLEIEKTISYYDEFSYDEDNLMSITDFLDFASKNYGINLETDVVINEGRISKIKIKITSIRKGLKIKDNLKILNGLVISCSDSQSINKITFYPKAENEEFTSVKEYYLLSDGNITEDANHHLRVMTVNSTTFFYADKDFENLETKARQELYLSSYDHSITFSINVQNCIFMPFENVNLGDFVEFYSKHKKFNTIVTQLRIKNNLNEIFVSLGEYRVNLTDKIQILNKNSGGSISGSASSSQIKKIDGGVY